MAGARAPFVPGPSAPLSATSRAVDFYSNDSVRDSELGFSEPPVTHEASADRKAARLAAVRAELERLESAYAAQASGQACGCGSEAAGVGFATLRALVKSCGRNGDVALAEEVLRFMTASGYPPCKEFYDILIHACAQAKDPARAETYFGEMAALGLEATEETYNTLLNACAAAGDADKASLWLFRMIDAGIQPNNVTYGTICKAMAHQGRVVEIENIMRMLERDGVPVNEYFYASLIFACGVATPPDPARALHAFNELLDRGLKPKSVRTVLQRVLGERMVAEMFQSLTKGRRPRMPTLPPPTPGSGDVDRRPTTWAAGQPRRHRGAASGNVAAAVPICAAGGTCQAPPPVPPYGGACGAGVASAARGGVRQPPLPPTPIRPAAAGTSGLSLRYGRPPPPALAAGEPAKAATPAPAAQLPGVFTPDTVGLELYVTRTTAGPDGATNVVLSF